MSRSIARLLAAALTVNSALPALARVETAAHPQGRAAVTAKGLASVVRKASEPGRAPTFGVSRPAPMPADGSILSEVGSMAVGVSADQLKGWKASADPLARLRLAEFTLAKAHNPQLAELMFARLIQTEPTVRDLARRGMEDNVS